MPKHKCRICSKLLSNYTALRNHLKTHRDELSNRKAVTYLTPLKVHSNKSSNLNDIPFENEVVSEIDIVPIDMEIDNPQVSMISLESQEYEQDTIDIYTSHAEDGYDESITGTQEELHNDIQELNPGVVEFMELITRYRLSDNIGDAIIKLIREFQRNVNYKTPTSTRAGKKILETSANKTFQKTKVINTAGEDYYLHYRPLIDCVNELLGKEEITKQLVFDYEELKINGKRYYKEQYNSEWWRKTKGSLPAGAKLLSLILYSDATTCDKSGRTSKHPIYLTLGNIPYLRRNKSDTKSLVGYLPIITATKEQKKEEMFRDAARIAFQNSFKVLLDPIVRQQSFGIELIINKKLTWCYMMLSVLIADWQEAANFCLMYKTYNCNRPCHSCLIQRDHMNLVNIDKESLQLRTPYSQRRAIRNLLSKEYSLHPMENVFWKLSNFNVYTATVPERMHHCDIGLFPYQLEFTREFLKSIDKNHVVVMDSRFSGLPKFRNIRPFKNGLEEMSRVTAKEYRMMMQIMPFIIDRIGTNIDNTLNNKLVMVYVKWNRMYITSRRLQFSEDDLVEFEKLMQDWATDFVDLFSKYSPTNLKLPKLHHWRYHVIDSIRSFGAVNGFTADTYESLHKEYVKYPYMLSNKRNTSEQMLTTISRTLMISKLTQDIVNRKRCHMRVESFSELQSFQFVFTLNEMDVKKIEMEKSGNQGYIRAFENLLDCVDKFIEDIFPNLALTDTEINDIKFLVFRAAKLDSGETIRASSKFHNGTDFSNVGIKMDETEGRDYYTDEGMCYGKVLILMRLHIRGEVHDVALIHWYDFKFRNPSKLYLYDCPLLRQVNEYHFVPIDSVVKGVHIIPRFATTGDFFVNKFVFE